MPHVIVTGGPGVGKTTLLAELAARGFNKPSKSRLGPSLQNALRGASRRPDAFAFAEEILRRDVEKYLNQPGTSEWIFFNRVLAS